MSVSNMHINVRPSGIYDTIRNAGYLAGSYLNQGNNAEQNYLHEYGANILRNDAGWQALFSDTENNRALNQMDKWDDNILSYAREIGYGSDKAQNDYNNASFNAVNINGDDLGTFNLSHLTDSQVDSLISVGTCKLSNGTSINVNSYDKDRIAYLRTNVKNEQYKTHLSNGTTGEKMQAYKDITAHIKERYDNAYNMLSNEARNAINSAYKKEDNKNPFDITKKGDKARLEWIDKALENNKLDSKVRQELLDLKKITDAHKSVGNGANVSTRLTARQHYGFSAITRDSFGNDFYTGIAFYKGVGNIGSRMGHLVSRSLPAQGLRSLVTGQSMKDIKAFDKQLMDARKAGSRREINKLKRDRKRNIADSRMNKRISKKELTLRQNPDNKRIKACLDKLRDKNGKRMARRNRADAFRKRFNEALGNIKKRWNNTLVAKFFKGFSNIVSFAQKAKKYVIMYGGGGLAVFLISLFTIIPVVIIFVHFLTEPTDLMGTLDSLNYGQYAVDSVNQYMTKPLLKTIKNDAEWHYNFDYIKGILNADYRHPSTGIDWNKSMSASEVGRIVDEYGNDITSLNENLPAIISMARFRYEDLWDFQNHVTPMAYAYNLFANTHRVIGYHYTDVDDCLDTDLYLNERFYSASKGKVYYGNKLEIGTTSGPEYMALDGSTQNGEFICENVYFHGYAGLLVKNSTISDLWAKTKGIGISVANWMRKAVGIEDVVTVGHESGLFVNELPYDSKGTCNHYRAYKYSSTPSCGKEEHVHTDACYRDVTTTNTEVLHEGSVSPSQAKTYKENGGAWNKDTKQWEKTTTETHKELVCGKEEHTHSPWQSESNPGCYDTAYLCLGHCGGHIMSTTDVEVICDVENIKEKDWMCLPASFTGETDFMTIFAELPTVDVWQAYWNVKTASMFAPLPLSPAGAIESLGRHLIYAGAGTIDFLTGLTNDIISLFTSGSVDSSAAREAVDKYWSNTVTNVIEDAYGFADWNDDALEEFKTWYGSYDELDDDDQLNPYYTGKTLWYEIGEVTFPVGGGRPLRDYQVDSIINSIKTQYTLTPTQEAVIMEALKGVGQFFYVETPEAQLNGATNNKGRTNGSGFISGIMNRSMGTDINADYSDFATDGIGYSTDDFAPGTILTFNQNNYTGGKWGYDKKKNCVAISLGSGYNMELKHYSLDKNKSSRYVYVIYIDDYGAIIKCTPKSWWKYKH